MYANAPPPPSPPINLDFTLTHCLSPCRHIRLLKELVQQLGPIGAAVQARLGEAQDEEQRALLQAQKDLALGLYEQLSNYLAYEDDVQVGGWCRAWLCAVGCGLCMMFVMLLSGGAMRMTCRCGAGWGCMTGLAVSLCAC